MYIGIDLGGTNIAAGAVSDDGQLLKKLSLPTKAGRDYKEIVKDMADLCETLAADTKSIVKAIGIGSPGAIDSKNGVIVFAGNLNFEQVPLVREMKRYFDVPIRLINDADAAAYGEYTACGHTAGSFVLITLGTGVGSGIIINNKLYDGFNGAGAEIGHMSIRMGGKKCNCGNSGCYEKYASVTALREQTEEAIKTHPESLMNEWVHEKGHISGRTAFECAKQGDKTAIEVRDTYIRYVAEGIINVINIFQPEILVIGGGISKEGDALLIPLREYVHAREFNQRMPKTDIRIARLFNDAGIIGAAMTAKNDI